MEHRLTTEIRGHPNLYPGFIHFSLGSLIPGSTAPCTIYLEAYNARLHRLRLVSALDAGRKVSGSWLARLVKQGLVNAYASQEDIELLQAYLFEQSAESPEMTPDKHAEVFYEYALCSIKAAMLEPRNGRRLAMGISTVRQIIDDVWRPGGNHEALLDVMSRDREIFTHCLNTCLLGVGYAHNQNWPRGEAEDLGIALFFHDLGMIREDGSGLVGTQEAGDIMEQDTEHPRRSRNYLREVPGIGPQVLKIVMNHHENLDGSGFPQGLRGSELSRGERLARLVDMYERLTSGLGAGEPLEPYAALTTMGEDGQHIIDQQLLQSFIKFLGRV